MAAVAGASCPPCRVNDNLSAPIVNSQIVQIRNASLLARSPLNKNPFFRRQRICGRANAAALLASAVCLANPGSTPPGAEGGGDGSRGRVCRVTWGNEIHRSLNGVSRFTAVRRWSAGPNTHSEYKPSLLRCLRGPRLGPAHRDGGRQPASQPAGCPAAPRPSPLPPQHPALCSWDPRPRGRSQDPGKGASSQHCRSARCAVCARTAPDWPLCRRAACVAEMVVESLRSGSPPQQRVCQESNR